mgnify:CR=1 FL=1
MELITGKQFNTKYPNAHVVKLTNDTNLHNDFQYTSGLNVLKQQFCEDYVCGPGGLYCCFKEYFTEWVVYNGMHMKNIWDVLIPDDAKVIVMNNKIKVDRFILSNQELVFNEKLCLYGIEKDLGYAAYIPEESFTHKICIKILGMGEYSLEYIPKKLWTKKLCVYAAKNNIYASKYIPEHLFNKELCYLMVKKWGYSVEDIPNEMLTYSIYLTAVISCGMVLANIPKPIITEELCIEAVKQNSDAFEFVPEEFMSYKLCLNTVCHDGTGLCYIPPELITKDLCFMAVRQNCDALAHVPKEFMTVELYSIAIKKNPNILHKIHDFISEELRNKIKLFIE